ncbi:MAG: amidohydrolase family protein [Anaerolineales bacterium]|nr:amidohydrolase family protein [Anaerolineales bacterium]
MFDIIIRNGTIVDGQKTPRFEADVGIQGDRITAIGDLAAAEAATTLDATDSIVAPGFIDVHTHSDAALLSTPFLASKIMQGITTEFLMLDGISYAPVNNHTIRGWLHYLRSLDGLRFEQYTGWRTIEDYMALLHQHTAQNVATFAPYANVRTLALGFGERAPNDYQLVDIERIVARCMAEGTLGLSTGLDYVDQCFAGTRELVAACRGMRAHQGIYATHVRYALGTLEGVREAVEIGRRAGVGVHISHLKGMTPAEAEAIIDYIDLVAINEVNFSFDVYPYMSSSTMLNSLLPLEIWQDGILAAYGKLADPILRDRFQRRLDVTELDNISIAWVASRQNSALQGKPWPTTLPSANGAPPMPCATC